MRKEEQQTIKIILYIFREHCESMAFMYHTICVTSIYVYLYEKGVREVETKKNRPGNFLEIPFVFLLLYKNII